MLLSIVLWLIIFIGIPWLLLDKLTDWLADDQRKAMKECNRAETRKRKRCPLYEPRRRCPLDN